MVSISEERCCFCFHCLHVRFAKEAIWLKIEYNQLNFRSRRLTPSYLQRVRGRREVLKKIGSGMVLGLSAGALIGHEQTAEGHVIQEVYASWIHGNTGHVQNVENLANSPQFNPTVKPFSDYLEISNPTDPFVPHTGTVNNWVHYGIPTQVLVAGTRLRLFRVWLSFETEALASVLETAPKFQR